MLWNSEGTEDHHFICLLGLLEGTLDLCQTGERSNSMCIWCASQSVSVSLCLYIHLATCLLLCVSYLEKWAKVICQLLTPWTALTPFQRFSEIKVSESGETVFPGKLRNLCQLEWLAFNIDYPLREPLTSLQFYQQAESFCKICSPQTCCLYSGFMLPGREPPLPKKQRPPLPLLRNDDPTTALITNSRDLSCQQSFLYQRRTYYLPSTPSHPLLHTMLPPASLPVSQVPTLPLKHPSLPQGSSFRQFLQ